MVKPEKVAAGVMSFAESELLPALDGWRFAIGCTALNLLSQRMENALAFVKDSKVTAALGLVDDDGNLDVDAAAEALKATLKKHGKVEIDIPLLGAFKFGEGDVDTLREHINKA